MYNNLDFLNKVARDIYSYTAKQANVKSIAKIRRIVYLTLEAVGENPTDCKIDGVMKYIEENK